jgi:tetratricopeptide (TPR) repeat protein
MTPLVRTRRRTGSNRFDAAGEQAAMRKHRLLLVVALAAALAITTLLGGAFSGAPKVNPLAVLAANAVGSPEQRALGQLLAGLSSGHTDAYIRRLERRVAHDPQDGNSLGVLALAYQQRARETGDPTYYKLSGLALRRASAAHGPVALIVQGEASLANTRHRFALGLRLAREAIGLDRYNGSAYAALGDALFNLGRYRSAFRVYDHMALLAPGVASFTRIGSARELIGHPAAAASADRLAIESGSSVPENLRWAKVQLGNVDFNMGRLDAAAAAYRRALRGLPGYVHAEAGLARVEASEGRYGEAIARFRQVVGQLPIPQYVIWLGDTYRASGRLAAARHEYALVGAIERLFAANGVRTELQTALFDLDHDHTVADALGRGRTAYASAPSIYAADAVAWGLYRSGRCGEARAYSMRALRLGTRDALLIFHRGMIERCAGHQAAGDAFLRRALAINPHFSLLWAPVARKALQ